MTVLDVFLDRPRVVPKQQIQVGGRQRKSSIGKTDPEPMPEIRECIVDNILPGNPTTLFSMDGNAGSPDAIADERVIKERELSNGSSPPHKRQKMLIKTNRTPVRNRRKSRWKLKFHHQALPPEYLRHYKQQERKRRQTETGKSGGQNTKGLRKSDTDTQVQAGERQGKKNGEDDDDDVVVAEVKVEESVKGEKTPDDGERLKTSKTSCASPLAPLANSGPSSAPAVRGQRSDNKSEPEGKRSSVKSAAEDYLQPGLARLPHLNIDVSQNKAFLENLLTNQIEINRVVQKEKRLPNVKTSPSQLNRLKSLKNEDRQKSYSIPPSGKIMNYSDLPYMGEITLDGIKPRRGRKPKKADICHLIYKNYGQVFSGAPESREPAEDDAVGKQLKWRPEVRKSNSSQRTKGPCETAAPERLDSPLPTVSGLLNHTEVQNRIINSLLEKRLTQEMKMKTCQGIKEEGGKQTQGAEDEEPLNLCLRDLRSLKIKLSRKHGNVYETKQREPADVSRLNVKTEVKDGSSAEEVVSIGRSGSDVESTDENDLEEDDLAPFNLVTTELRESSDEEDAYLNLGDQITLTRVKTPTSKSPEVQAPDPRNTPPMLFWSGSSLLLPGMSSSPLMCYPKISELLSPRFKSGREQDSTSPDRKLARSKSDSGRGQLKRRVVPSGNSGSTSKSPHAITKRKRSAIFIPPVPAESTTNPTTEVSICKFKFTGGAKPSLQEKKMLSVDSGGNFRYYSGTGDKSMRGYEYFPRESLQQCQENTGCSPSGVFLTASALGSGEKIPEEIGHSGFFDSDFPLPVTNQKTSEQKPKTKAKLKQKPEGEHKRMPPDVTCYRSLRDHLLGSKPDSAPDLNLVPDDDGNSSDQSGEFDLRGIPQGYFDRFKMHEDASRMSGQSGKGSSRSRKLRKTRKSIAREKLEQTFKEKGFLIQTQQLESAEGATYCKFRQLRKFTRYLFRSWKDYLPGSLRNMSVDAGVDNPEMVVNHLPEVSVKTEVGERLNESPD